VKRSRRLILLSIGLGLAASSTGVPGQRGSFRTIDQLPPTPPPVALSRQYVTYLYTSARAAALRSPAPERERELDDDNRYIIDFCNRPSFDVAEAAGPTPEIARADYEAQRLARGITWLERQFQAAGYPRDLWQKRLSRYVRRRIGLIVTRRGEDHLESLDSDLFILVDGVAQRLMRSMPEITPFEIPSCAPPTSVGGRSVVFETQPAHGRVWIISTFGFAVCRQRAREPWSPTACPLWREVEAADPPTLLGTYMYRVVWPDGRTRQGRWSFDPQPFAPSRAPLTITLRAS